MKTIIGFICVCLVACGGDIYSAGFVVDAGNTVDACTSNCAAECAAAWPNAAQSFIATCVSGCDRACNSEQ